MHKMMYINDAKHLCERDGVCYFVRRVPVDVLPYHSSNRISISLKTKSASAAVRAGKSINQRLEDCWLGLRLQNMDIPAIQQLLLISRMEGVFIIVFANAISRTNFFDFSINKASFLETALWTNAKSSLMGFEIFSCFTVRELLVA